MHDWNLQQGATMTMAGLWHRPWFFARNTETINEAYVREAETTRAPFLGEHTDEVLKSVAGVGDDELASLREKKIIQ